MGRIGRRSCDVGMLVPWCRVGARLEVMYRRCRVFILLLLVEEMVLFALGDIQVMVLSLAQWFLTQNPANPPAVGRFHIYIYIACESSCSAPEVSRLFFSLVQD